MPTSQRGQSVRVRTPASSANVGPGFDSVALALDLYDEVVVTTRADDVLAVTIDGVGADTLARDESNLLVSTIRTAAKRFDVDVTGIALHARNAIPHGRGLGSSAATIVAGVAAVLAMSSSDDDLDLDSLLALASEIEGHPDNVAACVLGGLTISWQDASKAHAVTTRMHPSITPVVLVPAETLSTSTARGLLPSSVSHVSAAFNAGRSALLVHALTAAPELLMAATQDRLHERYRAPAMPESAALIEALRTAGFPAVVSGAGPSVLVLLAPDDDVSELVPPQWSTHRLNVADGVQVRLVTPSPASEEEEKDEAEASAESQE